MSQEFPPTFGLAPQNAQVSRKSAPWWARLAPSLALCAITLVTYSDSFRSGFVLDNRFLILEDPRLREATRQNIDLILHHTYWWPKAESGLYRPVTTLSYLLNYAVLGNVDHPAGYHWINLFLHVGNVLLVYALALRLLRQFWPAAFVAALWAVHPVLTESVTNIIGRSDLLAAMTLLSGLLMYLKSTELAGWVRLAWLAGLMAVTTVGVFSKESAVAILGVIVLYELTWWKERKQLCGLFLGCLALAPPLLAMWYQRSLVLANSPSAELPFVDNPLAGADFVTARLTAIKVMARYVGLLLWPARLSPDYSYAQIPLVNGSLQDWIAWTVVAVIVVAVAIQLRGKRLWFFFPAFAFLTFLPVSNLVILTGTIMAERFLYLPALGFIACLVLALYWLGRRAGTRIFAPIILCAITAGFAVRTWVRIDDWRDDLALWTSAVHACPRSFKTHKNLAYALYESDPSHSNLDRVIDETEKALAILDPVPDSLGPTLPYVHAGRYYRMKGDSLVRPGPPGNMIVPPESIVAYQRSLQLLMRGVSIDRAFSEKQAQIAARRGTPSNSPLAGYADLYLELSSTRLRLGDRQGAFEAALHARLVDPARPAAYAQAAHVLLAAGAKEDAAVALMEGYLVTGSQTLFESLRELHQGGLDPKHCALTPSAAGPSLNNACEPVHKELCRASADLVQLYLEIRQRGLAERIKDRALQTFGCPAEPLLRLLPDGPVF